MTEAFSPRGHSAPSLILDSRKATTGVGQVLSPKIGVTEQMQTSLGLPGQSDAPAVAEDVMGRPY